MDYPINDPNALLHNGKFTDGDAQNAIPPSVDSAEYQNLVFDEIMNVITAGGESPDYAKRDQLLTGISQLIAAAIQNKSDDGHGHSIQDVSGLGNALAQKSDTGHGHAAADISGFAPQVLNDANIASGLNNNNTHGWVTLGNIRIEWGNGTVSGNGQTSRNFTTAYSQAPSVVATPKGTNSGGGTQDYFGVDYISTTTFEVWNRYDGGQGFYWIAIGLI